MLQRELLQLLIIPFLWILSYSHSLTELLL